MVNLNAWAYELETVSDHEHLVVDDPASIKHHRALNAILAGNNGIAPDNLQEQIDAWQPQSEEDKEPVTVDFSKWWPISMAKPWDRKMKPGSKAISSVKLACSLWIRTIPI